MITTPGHRIASLPLPDCRARREFSSRPGGLLTFLLVLPAAVLLLTPFGLLAFAAAAQPDMLTMLVEKPFVALQLALGLVVSVIFCTLPFHRFGSQDSSISGEPATLSHPLPDEEPDRQPLVA